MDTSALVLSILAAHAAVAGVIAALVIHRRGAASGRPRSHVHGLLGVASRAVAALVGVGVRLGPVRLLTVRGRTSGVPRSTPVDVFVGPAGSVWLVATHTAHAQWVRNLRATGEGRLSRGREQFVFLADELDAEDGAAVMGAAVAPRLARPWGGLVLRRSLGLPAHPDAAQLAEAVREHPVFALRPHPDPDSVPERPRDRSFVARHLIGLGVVVAFVHALAGALGVVTALVWASGVAVGLLVAGVGNHLRLAARVR